MHLLSHGTPSQFSCYSQLFHKKVSRVAIGKKVHSVGCRLKFDNNGNLYIYPNASDNPVHHILYNEIQEPHHYRCMNEESNLEANVLTNFISFYVEPNDCNKLDKCFNAYVRQKDTEFKYIVIEFQSVRDYEELIGDVAMVANAKNYRVLWDPNNKLGSRRVEKYAMALINDSKKNGHCQQQPATRRTRRSRGTISSVSAALQKKKRFLGSRRFDDVLLVYPFAGEANLIDGAANGLTEAASALHLPHRFQAAIDQPTQSAAVAAESSGIVVANTSTGERSALVAKVKQRAHFLTIRVDDYERLDSGEFLNDTLIDFWMQWCVYRCWMKWL